MENNELEVRELPYGEYEVDSFIISKELKVYDERLKSSLENAPGLEEIVKVAEKDGYIPFISIYAKSGIWKIEYIFGTSMYFAIDACTIDENNNFDDDSMSFINVLAHHLFSVSVVVGDVEFYKGIDNILSEWMLRNNET